MAKPFHGYIVKRTVRESWTVQAQSGEEAKEIAETYENPGELISRKTTAGAPKRVRWQGNTLG